jgi:hypothetical protein
MRAGIQRRRIPRPNGLACRSCSVRVGAPRVDLDVCHEDGLIGTHEWAISLLTAGSSHSTFTATDIDDASLARARVQAARFVGERQGVVLGAPEVTSESRGGGRGWTRRAVSRRVRPRERARVQGRLSVGRVVREPAPGVLGAPRLRRESGGRGARMRVQACPARARTRVPGALFASGRRAGVLGPPRAQAAHRGGGVRGGHRPRVSTSARAYRASDASASAGGPPRASSRIDGEGVAKRSWERVKFRTGRARGRARHAWAPEALRRPRVRNRQ